jgi:hypothetical protein
MAHSVIDVDNLSIKQIDELPVELLEHLVDPINEPPINHDQVIYNIKDNVTNIMYGFVVDNDKDLELLKKYSYKFTDSATLEHRNIDMEKNKYYCDLINTKTEKTFTGRLNNDNSFPKIWNDTCIQQVIPIITESIRESIMEYAPVVDKLCSPFIESALHFRRASPAPIRVDRPPSPVPIRVFRPPSPVHFKQKMLHNNIEETIERRIKNIQDDDFTNSSGTSTESLKHSGGFTFKKELSSYNKKPIYKKNESETENSCLRNPKSPRRVSSVKRHEISEDLEEQHRQRDIIHDKLADVRRMLSIELKGFDKKSHDPKTIRRKQKIEKIFKDVQKNSDTIVDIETQREVEDYLEEMHREQSERLKDNIALTEDIMIENDVVMVDSNIIFNKYVELTDDQFLSISLDILAIFLKSQKILYTEAKTYCEQQLNFLMMPAIFISALTTVLSMALDRFTFGAILIASLTAVNSFILAIISYLKLDAKSEAHKTSAYQFDKLQSKCEFGSGRVTFFNKEKYIKNEEPTKRYIDVFDLVDSIEVKVTEIKDMNKFILPEKIRKRYPNLYGINIFSAVKSYLTVESSLKAELTQCLEMLNSLRDEINALNNISMLEREPHRDLIYSWNINVKNKREIERQLIAARENYMKLDRSISSDFNTIDQSDVDCYNCCVWLKT